MNVPRGTILQLGENMKIKSEFEKVKIVISDRQEEQFEKMAEFLQDYSKKVNLTAIKDREGIIKKHFVDSVLPLAMTEVKQNAKCADIGTGAGFPALPMMILRPDLSFTLVDALQKRIAYLREVTAHIGVTAELLHARAEEIGKNPVYREQFDMVTARAVSGLCELSEYCSPLLKVGGIFLAMRGSTKELNPHTENVFELLGGKLEAEREYSLPDGDSRRIIIVRKINSTPSQYPRTAAQMQKKPL